VYSIKILWFL